MACFLVPAILALITTTLRKKFPKEAKINWLNALLWGGVIMLAVEHIAHEEIVPYPPFLTAGIEHVLPEMFSVGVPMTLAIIGLWGLLVLVPYAIPYSSLSKAQAR